VTDAITPLTLRRMKQAGERIAALTAYDASFARLLADAGVDVLLVGDSLGMVVQGHASTLPVSVSDMAYHTAAVARGAGGALVVADMPFASFPDPQAGLANAAELMRAGAHMVKLEGGAVVLETVRRLADFGIPVCAHLGLLPQSVHKLGGYRVQGREPAQAQGILDEAAALQQAGADLLVLEAVPADLASRVRRRLSIPVIGIGAGADCDGQVLVLYDMLGISGGRLPRFCRDFSVGAEGAADAVRRYVAAVKEGRFPGSEEVYR
jgi:3-methyl-2-oxobutanoate hydroxymethyltransferase